MSDLLSESVSRMNEQFLACMEKDSDAFSAKLRNCPGDELYLITPDYLTPYPVSYTHLDVYKRQTRTGGRIRKILTGMESAFRYLMKTEYRKSVSYTHLDVYKRQ